MSGHHFLAGSDLEAGRMASIWRDFRRNVSGSGLVLGRSLL